MANFSDMQAFVAVVDQKSFSQAGKELRLSTAVVSARVAKLEKDLGVRLLNRTTRRVSPTEEARQYYLDCKNILSQVDAAEALLADSNNQTTGVLKISVPVNLGEMYLPKLLAKFHEKYPRIEVRLHLSDEFVDILKEGYDAVLRDASDVDQGLVSKIICNTPRILCASPDYIEQKGAPQKPEDLLHHKCLLLRFAGSTQFQWTLDVNREPKTYAVKGQLDSNQTNILKAWACQGQGITLQPRWAVAEELDNGSLVEILPDYVPQSSNLHLLRPVGRFIPPKVRAFTDFVAENLELESS